ncbi:MAG: heme o synthase [Pirellulales bacterium]
MSTTTLSIDRETTAQARVSDYVELTKPRIAALVLVTVAVAAFVADWGPPGGWLLANTLLGTALVAASASALNQWLERDTDARMARTADRPLPAGRLNGTQVVAFGLVSIVLGTVYLAVCLGLSTAALGLITWTIYVWIYTPLKRRTSANTAIGAVAGALPVLMGWTAVGAPLDLRAWSLFLIVFLWQFPHFMAIAWIYRREYAGAGLKMLSTIDPSGVRTGAQAMLGALVLVPVSLVPCLSQPSGLFFAAWALALGLGLMVFSAIFFVQKSEPAARRLLLASLVYLPAMMGLLAIGPLA